MTRHSKHLSSLSLRQLLLAMQISGLCPYLYYSYILNLFQSPPFMQPNDKTYAHERLNTHRLSHAGFYFDKPEAVNNCQMALFCLQIAVRHVQKSLNASAEQMLHSRSNYVLTTKEYKMLLLSRE